LPILNKDNIGGFLMLASSLLAIIAANFTAWYELFIHFPISFYNITQPVKTLVEDGLMIIFFVYVGIELRHEFKEAEPRQVVLPCLAALGGMLVPSMIYMVINWGHPSNYRGFAIPCATDIAFAVCLFDLIGGRTLPRSVRTFLLSIAIFDDLGAVLLIAVFYGGKFSLVWTFVSMVLCCFLWAMAKYCMVSNRLYIILGLALPICFAKAGLHTTLSGFVLGFMMSPTAELKTKLRMIVQFVVLPIFAFVASGVVLHDVSWRILANPLFMGTWLGLFLGKPIGITLTSYIVVALKWARWPKGSNVRHVYVMSIFAAIGFTMSLFVGTLAFQDMHAQNLIKTAIVVSFLTTFVLSVIQALGLLGKRLLQNDI
jgi:NhaA family Na+:H+ antiporter